jgi:hypothetical protein
MLAKIKANHEGLPATENGGRGGYLRRKVEGGHGFGDKSRRNRVRGGGLRKKRAIGNGIRERRRQEPRLGSEEILYEVSEELSS